MARPRIAIRTVFRLRLVSATKPGRGQFGNPLLHYLQMGAAELRNPHPRFDAAYYVGEHPEAAANPLLYHLLLGVARGWLTEKPVDIDEYLP